MHIRVENSFEKRIIGQRQGLLSLTEIQKSLLPLRIQLLVASIKKREALEQMNRKSGLKHAVGIHRNS